ncbi:MAG: hypothetical protein DKINENOH_01667 [bacterium]|nr:hypothetical protein [bacterium]
MRTNQLAAQLLVWALLALPAVAVSQIARFEGSDLVLENRFIKVTLAAEQGMITSWLIKATGQELAYFDQAGSKGLLGARIWTENWNEEGGWPTEVGRTTWKNEIVFNSRRRALVRQSLVLSEGGVANGMKAEKSVLLTQDSYVMAAEYKLINLTDHTIAFTAFTLESTANTGPGGRLGYGEHGSNAVTIITQGQVVENLDFQWMAMEVETRDALFGTVFLDRRPAFALLYEGVGDNGRDMEPHFGPMNLASGCTETFHLLIYGGPGSLDWFSPGASSQSQSLLRMNEAATEKPLRFALAQNYPNPFNPDTEIGFALPQAGQVTLKIYNMLGVEIRALIEARFEAGYHRVSWDGRDNSGQLVGSGVYLYRLHTGEIVQVRKMSLLR